MVGTSTGWSASNGGNSLVGVTRSTPLKCASLFEVPGSTHSHARQMPTQPPTCGFAQTANDLLTNLADVSGELVTVENGLIPSSTLIFDWHRWPEVLQELPARTLARARVEHVPRWGRHPRSVTRITRSRPRQR